MPGERYPTPEAAEAAFYEAFEKRDIEAMMSVWADDGIVCVHPMGPRIDGRREVAQSWADIFEGGVALRFEPTDVGSTHSDAIAVHCVHEDISFGPGFRQRTRVIATNVYRRTEDGWRMIVHHASPVDDSEGEDEDDDGGGRQFLH